MAKTRVATIAFILGLCFLLLPFYVQAISTENAKEPIVIDKECSLTLSYAFDGKEFENLSVKLYKIADISTDFQYILTSTFDESALVINGIKTNSEWNIICTTLESYIISKNIEANYTEKTDSNGKASFDRLNAGLFLVLSVSASHENNTYHFKSSLVSVPTLDENGAWKYDVSANPKASLHIPDDQEINLKIIKLWNGDTDKNTRPKTIDVEIFCDGILYKTIGLSEENHWSYSWTAKNDGAIWTVLEKDIPSEYILTIEKRENAFVLTNTLNEEKPEPPPSTGDTSNTMFYIVTMILSGIILITIGILGKRKNHEQ